jgi:multidrug efflux system outer membrane protein
VNQQQYNLLTDFSYEIDLWGKLKAQETSKRHHLKAAQWEYEFIYQTLVTDVALRYFSCRTLQAENLFLEQALKLWTETIEIHESRIEAGLDSELDLSRAKLELALIEGEIETVKEQYALQEHALATLLGKPASSWSLPAAKLPKHIPQLPHLLPSEVVMRRADIQQQLALVAAGKSDVEAALRNYFPSFSISTTLGLSSPFISDFFQWQARYWGYLLNAVGTIFDGGSKNADLALAKARFSEHFGNYQKTVNLAFQDVEDALSTLDSLYLHLQSQKRAADAANDTHLLAQEQFETGLISYLLVADAKRTSIQTERQILTLQGREILAWIRLIKAFGIRQN